MSPAVRILHVVAGMGIGGAERIVVSLATHQRGAGHAVAVAAPPGALDAELAAAGVARFTFPERGRSRAGAALSAVAVARAVRASRAEIVHAHNVKASAIAWAGARLARRRVPLVATFHGVAVAEDAAAVALLRRMDRVACVAGELAARLRTAGLAPGRLTVIPNGICAAEPLDPGRRARIDAELDLGGTHVLAAVGRLAPVKAYDRFLHAAAALAALRPDVRFLLVGDGPERPALEMLAGRLGIAERVRFTGAREDARDLIARADAVVMTSNSEGLSLTALEALDAGVPVLAPAVAGMRELLAGGAGLLLADTRPETVADAAAGLLDDPARRREMGAAGRALVRERYAPARMFAAYDALYAELLASR
jgi:glycosyltransferase involved in cell wall biosynthesis